MRSGCLWLPVRVGVGVAALVCGAAACSSSTPDATTSVPSVATSTAAATSYVSAESDSGGVGEVPDPVGSAIRVVELKETLIELEASAALDALRTVAHPDGVDELLAALGADLERRDEVAPAGMKLRVAVIESMLVAESDDASSVALWVMQVVTGAGTTRVVYNTLRYDLGLVDGQWLLVHESSSAGPVPTPTQEPTDPTAFESSLTGFTDPIDDRAG